MEVELATAIYVAEARLVMVVGIVRVPLMIAAYTVKAAAYMAKDYINPAMSAPGGGGKPWWWA